MSDEDFDAREIRDRVRQMRAWSETKERRGKYRKAFVRSMRASRRHWQIRLAAGCARVFTLDGSEVLVRP